MTQSSLQTQCPNCQTRFRVTDEQLGIAKGKVRCGNCMSIFNAIEHQVMPASGQPPRKPAPPEKTPPEADSAGAGEEDFVFADNPEEDAAEGPYAGTKLTFSDDELSDSFRSFDERDEADYKDAGDHTPDEDVDESWAEAILNEDEPAARKPEPPTKAERDPQPAPRPEPGPELKPEEEPFFETTSSPSTARSEPAKAETSSFDDFVAESGFDFDEPDRSGGTFHAEPPFRDLRRDPVSADSGKGSGVRSVVWSV
ncbi:MAG: zinc-ribbon domain-containing protein, partial [Marinobacter sp.]|nr:zinc-ribbon domain-containing protein [Marinobacter sp.]